MALKAHPYPAGLEPYCQLVDAAHNLGYVTELGWDHRGWTLWVSETVDADPIVNVDLARPAPTVFNRLAALAAGKLEV